MRLSRRVARTSSKWRSETLPLVMGHAFEVLMAATCRLQIGRKRKKRRQPLVRESGRHLFDLGRSKGITRMSPVDEQIYAGRFHVLEGMGCLISSFISTRTFTCDDERRYLR